jgi:lipoprotein-anchoring transpeptidase ErfK/SrfK
VTSPDDAAIRSRLVPAILCSLLAVTLLAVGGAIWLGSDGESVVKTAASEPVPNPILSAGTPSGPNVAVPWDAPLTLTVTDGTLKQVTVVEAGGGAVDGTAVDDTTWRSTAASLLPAGTYAVTASVADRSGVTRDMTLTVHTKPADRLVHATISPGDGSVVGVGMPVIVRLDQPVKDPADRLALSSRLIVTTTPAVVGAWHWMDNTELHYRGPSYWAAGTTISVRSDLRRLQLSDGTWGSGTRGSEYRVGDAMISTVDVTAHVMAVRRNGKLLRIAKVSTGRDKYPTKGGVHIVLEKTRVKIMDSATVGIPRNSPDGYYEKVPFSVRISNGGAFVHSASWSVRSQGVANVSHGCVNMSPADAEWFYGLAKRGDIVNVIHAAVKPTLWDAGMSDWNIPFAEWAA